jgi:dsRNA-specific ribonuclease
MQFGISLMPAYRLTVALLHDPLPREVKQPEGGTFSYEVTAGGQTARGAEVAAAGKEGKKQAKQSAAKALLETLLGRRVEESKAKKAVVSEKKEPAVPRSRVEAWARCLRPPDDEDYVKQLKIFSLNSATGCPKYQVNNVVSLKQGVVSRVEVFCTWNQFYLAGRGETKSEAEQAAAGLMLGKIREVCGLGPTMPAVPPKAGWAAKAPVKTPPGPQGANLAAVLARVTARPELEPVQALEEAAHELGGDGPEYSIAGVENVGTTVTVTVSCSWRGLAEPGRAASKRLAEVAAARAMLTTLRQLGPGQLEVAEEEAPVKEEEVEDSSTQYCCFPPGL